MALEAPKSSVYRPETVYRVAMTTATGSNQSVDITNIPAGLYEVHAQVRTDTTGPTATSVFFYQLNDAGLIDSNNSLRIADHNDTTTAVNYTFPLDGTVSLKVLHGPSGGANASGANSSSIPLPYGLRVEFTNGDAVADETVFFLLSFTRIA
jgi:hypothetical protein